MTEGSMAGHVAKAMELEQGSIHANVASHGNGLTGNRVEEGYE